MGPSRRYLPGAPLDVQREWGGDLESQVALRPRRDPAGAGTDQGKRDRGRRRFGLDQPSAKERARLRLTGILRLAWTSSGAGGHPFCAQIPGGGESGRPDPAPVRENHSDYRVRGRRAATGRMREDRRRCLPRRADCRHDPWPNARSSPAAQHRARHARQHSGNAIRKSTGNRRRSSGSAGD